MSKITYLEKLAIGKKMNNKVAAATIGTTEEMFLKWARKKHTPSLRYAIRINKVFGNKVDFKKLLSVKDEERL